MRGDAVVLEAAADLYGRTPEAFTAARDERAAAARREGDPDLAGTIKAWRRPSAAAWAVNLLVRRRPEEMRRLVELGEALRRAQAELSGDDLRVLGGRRHQVVYGLAGEAASLAADQGRPLSDAVLSQVQATLDAALAHREAADAVASGRLVHALENTGMGSVDLSDAVAGPSHVDADRQAPGAAEDRRLAEIREAAAVVATDEDALGAAEEEATLRNDELQRAKEARLAARTRLADAEAALAAARDAAERASDQESEAAEGDDAARRGLEVARRRLERARTRLDGLRQGVGAPGGG